MLPIYRQRDKVNTLLQNESTFIKCQDYLLEGRHPIGIYTEGSHSFKRTIRPLKKGICRLAFETLDRNPELDLKIVPVGLNYNDHIAFQTDVLIIFGEGISVNPYYEIYLKNKADGCRALLADLRIKMGEIIIDIPDDENFDTISEKWLESRCSSDDLYKDFKDNQELVDRLVDGNPDDGKQIIIDKAKKQKKVKTILRIMLFPIWIYGFINNIIPTWFVRYFMRKFVKNDHFHSSIKFVLGTFGIPIIYLLQASLLYMIIGSFNLCLGYFLSLPLFSWIYFRWLR